MTSRPGGSARCSRTGRPSPAGQGAVTSSRVREDALESAGAPGCMRRQTAEARHGRRCRRNGPGGSASVFGQGEPGARSGLLGDQFDRPDREVIRTFGAR